MTRKKKTLISTDIGTNTYTAVSFGFKDDSKDNKILIALVNIIYIFLKLFRLDHQIGCWFTGYGTSLK